MDDLGLMSLSKFRLWSTKALKVYLSNRKRSVEGSFDELVARAFCVWEEVLPVDITAEQAEQRLLEEYKRKLLINDDVVPDPFSLKAGWKGEKVGISLWPSVYITDISTFLNGCSSEQIVKRLLSEYKEGKAYRYFSGDWVKEVYIHEVREGSDKSILKTKVTPSQCINNKAYDVWAIIEKDSLDRLGGKVLSAYCSCTAGMLGCCNHVAGLLFRIEHAVKTGETKKTSTSKLSTWNVPKGKPVMKPVKACDVSWTKAKYGQSESKKQDDKWRQEMKKQFTPLSKIQKENVKNEEQIRENLYNLLKSDINGTCFANIKEKVSANREKEAGDKLDLTKSVIELSTTLISEGKQSCDALLECMKLTPEQALKIKEVTKKQSNSDVWFEQRKGRITASNFKRVCSRVDTMKRKSDTDPSALVKIILGQETKQTAAMKHGLALEPVAKQDYTRMMKSKHKKFKSGDTGLTVLHEKPYLAASVDLEVECECCGRGLCEIKCPESIKDQVPSPNNTKYLIMKENKVTLTEQHQYFYQIQGQLGITGRQYCDLFVFTCHGYQCVRVDFDPDFWETMQDKLSWFWLSSVVPELLSADSNKENESNTSVSINSVDQSDQVTLSHTSKIIRRPLNMAKQSSKRQKVSKTPVYLCGSCGLDILENPQCEKDQSIYCDGCSVWVHYICAGVKEADLKRDLWLCSKCK